MKHQLCAWNYISCEIYSNECYKTLFLGRVRNNKLVHRTPAIVITGVPNGIRGDTESDESWG